MSVPLPRARTNADDNLGISVLYIGGGKSGKTTCAMSWPDPFVLYFDHNVDGLRATNPTPPYLLADDLKPDPITALTGQILPAIAAGRIGELTDRPVKTIVVDSLTVLLGNVLARKINPSGPLKGYDNFGALLYLSENLVAGQLKKLVSRGYNVVCTVHLGDYGGENQPSAFRPTIPGSYRDQLCGVFGATLLTRGEQVTRTVTKGGQSTTETVTEHYVLTSNPDRRYDGIGDTLGREGGRFRPLPPKLDGRYPSLAKAWGLPE